MTKKKKILEEATEEVVSEIGQEAVFDMSALEALKAELAASKAEAKEAKEVAVDLAGVLEAQKSVNKDANKEALKSRLAFMNRVNKNYKAEAMKKIPKALEGADLERMVREIDFSAHRYSDEEIKSLEEQIG